MIWAVAALLVLQPVLDEAGTLRLVAVGPPKVAWAIDGRPVGTAGPREPIEVQVAAGGHTVTASTNHTGPWQVLARLDPRGPGIAYAPAWTASSPGHAPRLVPGPAIGLLLLVLVAAAIAQSKRP